jgi:DNA-binding LacI/PurR family transcriptional regulator
MKRATQNDVASLAGVSRATVSYVLNGRADGTIRVSDDTRSRIQDAMRELGYRVNLKARGLRTDRSQLVAVLVPDLGNPFYPMLIRGAQQQAHARGYRLLVSDSFSSEEGEREFMETALDHIADGLVLATSYLGQSDVRTLLDDGIPCVGIGPLLDGTGIDTISIDQDSAVRTLIGHLASRGHSRIAHLTGDRNNINGKIRYEAFLREMKARALELDEASVLEGDFLREGTAAKVETWFSSTPPGKRPSALFAANDLMAIEAMKAFRRMGLRIPDDVAVCGFDNIPEAEYVEPPLTTVGFDVESMGREAARLLIDRIESDEAAAPRKAGLPFDLFIRESA